jgi:mono/diheme cytochrome c family protein
MSNITKSVLVVAMTALGAVCLAQTKGPGKFDTGKREYESKCVVCHGHGGRGDGSYAELLKTAASDLTTLKKKNGGVFPVERVYAVIDGREAIKSHGERDMPIWGNDFNKETVKAAEYYADVPYDMETYVRARILALIDYLNRLQAR